MKSRITALLAILLFISIVINLQQYHTRIMNIPKQADTKNHYDQFTNRLYHTDQSMKDYQQSQLAAARNTSLIQAAGYAGEAANELNIINASTFDPREQPLDLLARDITDIHNKLQLYAIAAAGGHDPANTDIQRTSIQINKLMAALQHTSLQDEHSFAEIRAAAEAVNSLYRE